MTHIEARPPYTAISSSHAWIFVDLSLFPAECSLTLSFFRFFSALLRDPARDLPPNDHGRPPLEPKPELGGEADESSAESSEVESGGVRAGAKLTCGAPAEGEGEAGKRPVIVSACTSSS